MENRYRQDLERFRQDHQKRVNDLESQHLKSKNQHETEKSVLEKDKLDAIEKQKMQLTQLNKIDIDNKEMHYNKERDNLRTLFVDN